MTALPPKTSFTGATVTQGGFKQAMDDLNDYLSQSLGTSGGQVSGVFAAGSLAAPPIAFTGSLTTGFYKPAADEIGVSIAGVQALRFRSSGFISAAGALAITGGDFTISLSQTVTNTSPAANTASLLLNQVHNFATSNPTVARCIQVQQTINGVSGTITDIIGIDVVLALGATNLAVATYSIGALFKDASVSGGSITNQIGIQISDLTVGTGANRAIYSGVSAGTGKRNLYIAGTAINHLQGAVMIGSDTDDGVNKLQVTGAITVSTGNSYKVNNVQVVAARDTGWSAMTGTANKATVYDTASVTLAQLAGRVMSIQSALTTHGLIGA